MQDGPNWTGDSLSPLDMMSCRCMDKYFSSLPLPYQVLYLLGAMALSMALQLDRHGLWNLLGPSLFALGIMAIAWVSSIVHMYTFHVMHPY